MGHFENFDDKYCYYIHGTNNDDIENFFNKGLVSYRGNSINSTLYPIDNEEILSIGLRQIEQDYTKQHNFKYAYIIKIPNYYMGYIEHRDGSIEPPIPLWIPTSQTDAYNRKISILTPHIIAGVYSRERNQIMPNPNYNPKYNPEGMQYANEQEENMLNSFHSEYLKWMEFARARRNFGYKDLKARDQKHNIWRGSLQRYDNLIPEKFSPRPAKIKKKSSDNLDAPGGQGDAR